MRTLFFAMASSADLGDSTTSDYDDVSDVFVERCDDDANEHEATTRDERNKQSTTSERLLPVKRIDTDSIKDAISSKTVRLFASVAKGRLRAECAPSASSCSSAEQRQAGSASERKKIIVRMQSKGVRTSDIAHMLDIQESEVVAALVKQEDD